MKRRDCLKASLALPLPLLPLVLKAAAAGPLAGPRVRPGTAGWPGRADWTRLSQAVGGRLSVRSRRSWAMQPRVPKRWRRSTIPSTSGTNRA